MKSDKTEAVKGRNRANEIFSSDLVAQSILIDLYSALKDKERTKSLSALEIEIIESIESNYLRKKNDDTKRIKLIIEEAQSILNDTSKWRREHKDLYSTLERIVFLGMKENEFSEYFKEIEKSVNAILQLDFSEKVPLTNLSDDKRNLLNYISIAFNMIIEKFETSIVSRKAFNALLTSYPDSIVIITDKNGSIRFVNDFGEIALKSNLSDLIGTNIKDIIEAYDDSLRKLQVNDALKSIKVAISAKQNNEQNYHLSIPEVIQHPSEITELVHILRNSHESQKNKQFDLKLDSSDQVIPLNLIIGAASSLEESLSENDANMEWVKTIKDAAWYLKEKAQGSVLSLTDEFPDYVPIDFRAEIEETINKLSTDFDTSKINFDINVPKGLNFLSSQTVISSLLESFISNSLKFIGEQISPKIEVEVIDRKDEGVSILVKDNGIGMPKKMQKQFFEDDGMKTVSQMVEKLNGKIELKSKVKVGTTIKVDLPH